MLKLVLVRHGTRETARTKHLDPLTGLTREAREEAARTAAALATLIGTGHAIRCSEHRHSLETAGILAQRLAPNGPAVASALFLTPKIRGPRWSDVRHRFGRRPCGACEARTRQIDYARERHWANDGADGAARPAAMNQQEVVEVWVGHETRLSQLVLRYTRQRERQLEPLEAICLTMDSEAFLTGQGKIAWRYPVRNWLEQDIKQKLQSKMVAATFLASANFVALLEILVSKPGESNLAMVRDFKVNSVTYISPALKATQDYMGTSDVPSVLRDGVAAFECIAPFVPALALGCFVAAAALFISTVYLYDRLAMPEGFWTQLPFGRRQKVREQVRLHGYPYFHMTRIWSRFFTSGVVLSFLGIALLTLHSVHPVGIAVFLALSLAAYYAYRRHRPTGDID